MLPSRRLQSRLALTLVVLGCAASALAGGLVVTSVRGHGGGGEAGLEPGDLLLEWHRGAGRADAVAGRLDSPFGLYRLRWEELPRGPVVVVGERRGGPRAWRLASEDLGVETRPRLEDALAKRYGDARTGLGPAALEELARSQLERDAPELAAWLLLEAGTAAADAEDWTGAIRVVAEVQELAATRLDPLDAAWARVRAQAVLRDQGALRDVARELARSLRGRLGLAPEGLSVAAALNGVGIVAFRASELDAAELRLQQALHLYIRRAPGSLALSGSLNNSGAVASRRDELRRAERFYQAAIDVKRRLHGGRVDEPAPLNNLGMLVRSLGDLERAETILREALEVNRRLQPGSLSLANTLRNLGAVAFERGDLESAETMRREALAIDEKIAPLGLATAADLGDLGLVAQARGDVEGAIALVRRQLEICQRIAPDSLDTARALSNLGALEAQHDPAGDGEQLVERALGIMRERSPRSLLVAETLGSLGDVAWRLGKLEAARRRYEEALTLAHDLAPGSLKEATILAGLSRVAQASGQPATAARYLESAVDVLEEQLQRLGGTPLQRSELRASKLQWYRDLERLLLDLSRPADAFRVTERSRARTLLVMLAERDLEVPAEAASSLEPQRRKLALEYEKVLEATSSATSPEDAERLRVELAEISRQHEELRSLARATSPRYASLRYPQPVDLQAARSLLPAGTTVLSYSVGEVSTILYVLAADGSFEAITLPVGDSRLRAEVEWFRGLIAEGPRDDTTLQTTLELGEQLYQQLVEPAAEAVGRAERIVVVPDGVLHLLPFCALVRRTGEERKYLVEWKPISTVTSLTMLGQLSGSASTSGGVVAFADPRIPPIVAARGERLPALPAARSEARLLEEMLGASVFLGGDATESRAKSLPRSTRLLHFATHVVLDERFPLSSGVVLSDGSGEDGLLQAWEILESLRIDADLVVLSGCQTALGREVAGEGLVGLTQAFHFAGARALLTSLWRVGDEPTAELMRRFYAHLKAGLAKDEALRRAQVELIHPAAAAPALPSDPLDAAARSLSGLWGSTAPARADLSHPLFWAAFRLEGDAR